MDDMLSMNKTTGYITRLESLKEQYKDNSVVRKNGTLLLDPGKIPKCRHMLYYGLDNTIICDYLEADYANVFPVEYKKFLLYTNGADLFWVKRTTAKGIPFAKSMLSFYGLPRTQPFGRPKDMEEPFDLRIEDLARHKKTPKEWLKCGSYYSECDSKVLIDIFIDTESGKVYACNKNECDVLDSWDSFDECFCSIFDSYLNCKTEYEV